MIANQTVLAMAKLFFPISESTQIIEVAPNVETFKYIVPRGLLDPSYGYFRRTEDIRLDHSFWSPDWSCQFGYHAGMNILAYSASGERNIP